MALEKFMKSPDFVPQPPKDKRFRFRFPPAPRCGTSVIDIVKLGHGFGKSPESGLLFQNVDISIERGDRIGFVGPNGSGKVIHLVS